jgi:hypothetical protein
MIVSASNRVSGGIPIFPNGGVVHRLPRIVENLGEDSGRWILKVVAVPGAVYVMTDVIKYVVRESGLCVEPKYGGERRVVFCADVSNQIVIKEIV